MSMSVYDRYYKRLESFLRTISSLMPTIIGRDCGLNWNNEVLILGVHLKGDVLGIHV